MALSLVPSESAALFLGYLLHEFESTRVALFCACHEEKVQQCHGRRVRSVKRKRVYGGQIELIGKTCHWREVSVRYADAVRALFASLLDSLDRHPQTAAKADGNDEVILIQGSDGVDRQPRHGRTGYGQAKDSEMVFEVSNQTRSDISTEEKDSFRLPDSLGNRRNAFQIHKVVKSAQVLEFMIQ